MPSDNTKPLQQKSAQYDLPDGTSRWYRLDTQQEMALRGILDYIAKRIILIPATKVDLDRSLLVTVMKLESAQSVKLLSKFMGDGVLKRAGYARYRLAMSGVYVRSDPQGNRSEWNLTEPAPKHPQLTIDSTLAKAQLAEIRRRWDEDAQGFVTDPDKPKMRFSNGTLVEVGTRLWTQGTTYVYNGETEEGEKVLVIFTE